MTGRWPDCLFSQKKNNAHWRGCVLTHKGNVIPACLSAILRVWSVFRWLFDSNHELNVTWNFHILPCGEQQWTQRKHEPLTARSTNLQWCQLDCTVLCIHAEMIYCAALVPISWYVNRYRGKKWASVVTDSVTHSSHGTIPLPVYIPERYIIS